MVERLSNIPVPDPSLLTTVQSKQLEEQMRREMGAIREYLLALLNAQSDISRVKADNIAQQFTQRDREVTNAFQAQEKAMAKSEGNFHDRIKGIETLLLTNDKSTSEKIGALSSRLDRGEGSQTGSAETRTEKRLDTGTMIAIGALIVAILTAIVNVSVLLHH